MIKILLIGDIHFHARKLNDISDAWNRVINYANKNKIDLVVQAGDMFDHYNVYGREASTGTIYKALLEPFNGENSDVKLFTILGNHDIGGPNDHDALSPIDQYPWINVRRRPEVCTPIKTSDYGVSICCLPWINRANVLGRFIKKGMSSKEAQQHISDLYAKMLFKLKTDTEKSKKDKNFVLFLGHCEVTGAKLRPDQPQIQSNGVFEFSEEQLLDLNCDAYALGHIHYRQHLSKLPNKNDGYLGALCQRRYDEEGNPTGYRLISIDEKTGKSISDEWIDDNESPKYYTVSNLSNLAYKQKFDNVKMRGEEKPETIPEGVIFERLPAQATDNRRITETLDATTPIEKLLQIWRQFAGCDISIEILLRYTKAIENQIELPIDCIGSFDRVDSIILHNIACHKNLELNLENINGLCSLEGPNGVGKTTTIESIPMGLFGKSPTRHEFQSVFSTFTDEKDALIEVGFKSNNADYRVRRELRKTDKTFNQKAYIFKDVKKKGISPEAIAGPKVDDVLFHSKKLVGDPDMVFAGIFSSQNEIGNLISLQPAQRKEIFAKLLNTENFLLIGEKFREQVKELTNKLESLKSNIIQLQDMTPMERDDEIKLNELRTRFDVEQIRQKKYEEFLTKSLSEVAVINSEKENNKKLMMQQNELKQKKTELEVKGKALRLELENIQKLDLKKAEDDLQLARKSQSDYNKEYEEFLQNKTIASNITQDINNINDTRGKEKLFLQQKVSSAKVEIEHIKNETKQYEKRAELLQKIPNVSACRECPLAADGFASKNMLVDLKDKYELALKTFTDCEELMRQQSRETIRIIESKKSALDSITEQIKSKQHILNELKDVFKDIDKLQKNYDLASKAEQNIANLDVQLTSVREQYKSIDNQLKSIVINEINNSEIAAKVAKAQKEYSEVQNVVNEFSKEVGRYEIRLENYKKNKEGIDKINEEISKLENDIIINTALSKAFGRDGIPQLILESSIPHFQNIMIDLLKDFDNKWAIHVESHKMTQKGAIKEEIIINVDDGQGARDISTYSGGEAKILRSIIRISFAILQSERSGKGLKILVLDEATDAMDYMKAETFVRMLNRLSHIFNQVFVVSHSDQILAASPTRIIFVPMGNNEIKVDILFAK